MNAQSVWEFNISLDGWFPGIDGKLGLPVPEQQVAATASDLLKHLLLLSDLLKLEI